MTISLPVPRKTFKILRSPCERYWYVCQDGHYVIHNDMVLLCLRDAGILQAARGIFFREPLQAAAVLRFAGFDVEVDG